MAPRSPCRQLCAHLLAQAAFLKVCSLSAVRASAVRASWSSGMVWRGRHSGGAQLQAPGSSCLCSGYEHWVASGMQSQVSVGMVKTRVAGPGLFSKEQACCLHLTQGREWSLPGCCWNRLHVLNFSWHSPQWCKSKKLLSFQSRGLWSALWLSHVRSEVRPQVRFGTGCLLLWSVTQLCVLKSISGNVIIIYFCGKIF